MISVTKLLKLLDYYLVTMRREDRLCCVTVQKPSLWHGHIPPAEHFGPVHYAEANKLYRIAKLKGALCALGITDIRAEHLEPPPRRPVSGFGHARKWRRARCRGCRCFFRERHKGLIR